MSQQPEAVATIAPVMYGKPVDESLTLTDAEVQEFEAAYAEMKRYTKTPKPKGKP